MVPNSGIPKVPIGQFISSFVTPSASGLLNILNTFWSSSGISLISTPSSSDKYFSTVGSSCPSISSLSKFSSISWYSKWVVNHSDSVFSAGNWNGVKSYISFPSPTTTIPPGCWPLVLLTPVIPIASLSISAFLSIIPFCSHQAFTNPKAVFVAIVDTVPAL